MAINTLLNYLKETKKLMNIQFNQGIVNDVKIVSYVLNDNLNDRFDNRSFIYLDQGHELRIDLSDFKIVRFDAIVSNAKDSIEMHECLEDLKECEKFNAYLEDSKDKCILSFLFICDENAHR